MTGEMSKADVTEEAFPLHFAIAKAIGGTVEPFDVYQGPYISTPTGERLFVASEDGDNAVVWNERTDESSSEFSAYTSRNEDAVDAAHEVYAFR